MGGLHVYLRDRAERTPDAEAVVSGDKRFTYQAFFERVNQLSMYLQSIGVQKGDRVGILCKNNHPFPTILFAVLQAGAVAMPINWRLTAYEMEGIIQTGAPKVLFYDEEFAHSLSHVKGMIEFAIAVEAGGELTDAFASIFENSPPPEPPAVPVSDEDLALILFTSGTTGISKGCMISHGCYDAYLRCIDPDLRSGFRFLAVHPLFHMSSTSMILFNVYLGNTMVFLDDNAPVSILKTIEKEKINAMFAFPSVYTYLLEEIRQNTWDLSSLVHVASGGTRVPASLIRSYAELGIPMGQGYGSTEASFVSHWNLQMGLDTAESVGKLFPGVQLKIVHPDTGEELPPGQTGELMVKSPYIFKGYLNNPEATQKVLIDGWVRMGDAGRLDENGFLYISGRYKEMILYGGDNVYPAEIEEVIHQIEGVMEVAVIGVPHETMGEAPRAYVIKSGNSPLTESDIVRACKEKLAEYKIPEVVFVADLPKNGLGKVMKHVLREQALSEMPVRST
ncbi:long-chain fatty acid--CoA ligase [Brevibacillus borstelensis]|jgi:long-chain acyl-CoA synthetase|uniref:class I adenylate-forming enzyme family protein n=1 Tax=Brevibacillus borstelensis TaxID=45462 RepID=UPI000F07B441|nr:class I adenylate-forming enzyme family protein [Brevibacillus borstelensis]MED1873342.1 class I adenylate-forming enzyme family protein [Brevibacillus borstelensis]MED1881304.1 class I adenylate-forming enzyme family protein [Brevibacillus borstelensis]RNB66772.1 long-chain fatty acid--CoA ligase [Brevibacillus borstelensis]GED52316.1 acyl--CoA ligase [Brevibacillus borstelensis]